MVRSFTLLLLAVVTPLLSGCGTEREPKKNFFQQYHEESAREAEEPKKPER